MNSCVYVIADDVGYCKIGSSVLGNCRVREVISPLGRRRWAVACTQRSDKAYAVEAAAHNALTDYRLRLPDGRKIRGSTEWFRVSVDVALAAVAKAWSDLILTDCGWEWDETRWGWRSMRMSEPDFASKRRPKRRGSP